MPRTPRPDAPRSFRVPEVQAAEHVLGRAGMVELHKGVGEPGVPKRVAPIHFDEEPALVLEEVVIEEHDIGERGRLDADLHTLAPAAAGADGTRPLASRYARTASRQDRSGAIPSAPRRVLSRTENAGRRTGDLTSAVETACTTAAECTVATTYAAKSNHEHDPLFVTCTI